MQRASITAAFIFSTRIRAVSTRPAARKRYQTAECHAEPEGTANASSGTGFARAKIWRHLRPWQTSVAHGRDEERSALHRNEVARPTPKRTSSRFSQLRSTPTTSLFLSLRAVVATWPTLGRLVRKNSLHSRLRASAPAWPNPSVNRSANGRPPSPGRWYAVHFHRPGLGVLPSSPGYLER